MWSGKSHERNQLRGPRCWEPTTGFRKSSFYARTVEAVNFFPSTTSAHCIRSHLKCTCRLSPITDSGSQLSLTGVMKIEKSSTQLAPQFLLEEKLSCLGKYLEMLGGKKEWALGLRLAGVNKEAAKFICLENVKGLGVGVGKRKEMEERGD